MIQHALIIDYGMSAAKAAAAGPTTPPQLITFDGHSYVSTTVYPDERGNVHLAPAPGSKPVCPAAAFGKDPADSAADPATLAAVTLRHIHTTATAQTGHAFDTTVLLVPAYSGPQWRNTLRRAAGRAQLPAPQLADSATTHLDALTAAGAPHPDGSITAICDLGAAATDITVVQNVNGRHEILAATRAREVSGDTIDILIAAHLYPENPDTTGDPAELAIAQTLKHQLSAYPTATADGKTLTQTELRQLAHPLWTALAGAIKQAAAHSDTTLGQWAGLYMRGGTAQLPGAADALHHSLGIPVITVADPATAAVRAAATRQHTTANPTPTTKPGLKAAKLASPLLLIAASILLFTHTLMAADVYAATYSTGQKIITAWAAYGLAAFIALHAAATIGHLLAAAGDNTPDAKRRRRNLRTGAIFTGLAAAVIYGLTAQLYLETDGNPILPITMWCTIPAAVVLLAAHHLTPAVARPRSLPASSLLCAAAGTAAITAGLSGDITLFGQDKATWTILIWAGGGLSGAAIGLLLTRSPGARIYTCGILAIIGMMLASISTRDTIAYTYVITATMWTAGQSIAALVDPARLKKFLSPDSNTPASS
ncbi:Hsp70 family protein [Catelliglobosispora koreensis]|uniref:Hsp70 family protein n=1 Tax=Catelliglobosispora koreensis TaxID=129052 RepID=UPI00037C3C8D|nr:Hsp70 family protein [Catelliglobosispora koreensis]